MKAGIINLCDVNRADQMVPYYHAAEKCAMDQGICVFLL